MTTEKTLTNTTGREFYIYQLGMLTDKLQSRVNTLENNYKNIYNIVQNGATSSVTGLARPYTLSFINTINATDNKTLNLDDNSSDNNVRKTFLNMLYNLYILYYVGAINSINKDEFKTKIINQLNSDFAVKLPNNKFTPEEIISESSEK